MQAFGQRLRVNGPFKRQCAHFLANDLANWSTLFDTHATFIFTHWTTHGTAYRAAVRTTYFAAIQSTFIPADDCPHVLSIASTRIDANFFPTVQAHVSADGAADAKAVSIPFESAVLPTFIATNAPTHASTNKSPNTAALASTNGATYSSAVCSTDCVAVSKTVVTTDIKAFDESAVGAINQTALFTHLNSINGAKFKSFNEPVDAPSVATIDNADVVAHRCPNSTSHRRPNLVSLIASIGSANADSSEPTITLPYVSSHSTSIVPTQPQPHYSANSPAFSASDR